MVNRELEIKEIKQVIQDYKDSCFNKNPEKLKSLFHPQAIMVGYLKDQLIYGTPEPFINDIANNPSMAESGVDFKSEIKLIEVAGKTATVIYEETGFFGEVDFSNFFHLLKGDEGWKIVCKAFTSI